MIKKPCPRCLRLAEEGEIRIETVMPLMGDAADALAFDGSGKCCIDCASADSLMRYNMPSFLAARVVVGNARQESMRLPGAPIGLAKFGYLKNSGYTLQEHHAWLDEAIPDWLSPAADDPPETCKK